MTVARVIATRLLALLLAVGAPACKREPDATRGTATAGSTAPAPGDAGAGGARGSGVVPPAPRNAAATDQARMPIAAAKLELVGNSTIKALEVSADGEVRVGDKVYGTLSPDGRFTRDGKVLAELGADGDLVVGGEASDPPIRIDPEGDVFLDGELMMTIDDDGKINTVGKDGAITENVLALLDGPPQGRRAVAMLLVLISTAKPRAGAGPSDVSRGAEVRAEEPAPAPR